MAHLALEGDRLSDAKAIHRGVEREAMEFVVAACEAAEAEQRQAAK